MKPKTRELLEEALQICNDYLEETDFKTATSEDRGDEE